MERMTKIHDEYGRVAYDATDLCKLLMSGRDILTIPGFGPEVELHNQLCKELDRLEDSLPVLEPLDVTPEEFHKELQKQWFIPEPFASADIRSILLESVTTQQQIDRVNLELAEFEAKNCMKVLNFLLYLVSIVEDNKIVMGVGRGSSIACYCLYLLGVHMIDSLAWDLDPSEFFKELNISGY